jgi:predicted outer membrane repeat protein
VLVQNSDVTGANSSGGGLSLLWDSTANLGNMFFANNSAMLFGGAVFVQGSTINMSNSTLLNNSLPGTPDDWFTSYGSAIFTTVDDSRKINAAGLISNDQFIGNSGMAIFDDDRNISNSPYNAVIYNSNSFYSTFYPQKEIYRDSLSNKKTASGLNSLVIDRSAGGLPATDKSMDNNNIDLASSPVTGMILAVPSAILTTKASGDENLTYYSFLAYAWNGSPADLNGNPLNGSTSVTPTNLPMSYALNVNGTSYTGSINDDTGPIATFTITPSGLSYVLNWSVICNGFLDSYIDQDISASTITTNTVTITAPDDLTFHFYALAQDGGVVVSRVTGVNADTYPNKVYIPLVKN